MIQLLSPVTTLSDPYLNLEVSQRRLIEEYFKHRNHLVVGFDFDNTVYDFHKQGFVFPKVIQLLKDLKSIGCTLICVTANPNTKLVKDQLKKLEIEYDYLNEQPSFFDQSTRKIYCNALLDDRAGLAQVYQELHTLVQIVRRGKRMYHAINKQS